MVWIFFSRCRLVLTFSCYAPVTRYACTLHVYTYSASDRLIIHAIAFPTRSSRFAFALAWVWEYANQSLTKFILNRLRRHRCRPFLPLVRLMVQNLHKQHRHFDERPFDMCTNRKPTSHRMPFCHQIKFYFLYFSFFVVRFRQSCRAEESGVDDGKCFAFNISSPLIRICAL